MADHASVAAPPRVATPLPIGLAGLAIASLVISGLNLGWVPARESHQIALILLTVPTVLQLGASAFAAVTGDAPAGTAFGVLGVSWLAQGLVHLSAKPGQVSNALGLLLLAVALILLLTAVAVARTKLLPAVTLSLASLHFTLAGIYQLSGRTAWEHVAGVEGLVLSGLATCGVLVFQLADQSG